MRRKYGNSGTEADYMYGNSVWWAYKTLQSWRNIIFYDG